MSVCINLSASIAMVVWPRTTLKPSCGHFRRNFHRLSGDATTLCRCSALASASPENGNNSLQFVPEGDIHALLRVLPRDLHDALLKDAKLSRLVEVTLEELEQAQHAIGEFGSDNRAGIAGTLHRICAIRNRKGEVIGLTCRVGRAVHGQTGMVKDLLDYGESILFVGRPGVGKTTLLREISHICSDELQKRVVIVDTSNEIGGDGDIPHAAIGGARRLQVQESSMQHLVMIEAVENHMPEVIIVDEIGTEAEVDACRTIAERGVMLIGTAHGERLENIMKNHALSDLIGGIESITVGANLKVRKRNNRKECGHVTSWAKATS